MATQLTFFWLMFKLFNAEITYFMYKSNILVYDGLEMVWLVKSLNLGGQFDNAYWFYLVTRV